MSNRRPSRWRASAQMSTADEMATGLRRRPEFIGVGAGPCLSDAIIARWDADQFQALWNFIRQAGAVPALPLALPAPRAAHLEVRHAFFRPNP